MLGFLGAVCTGCDLNGSCRCQLINCMVLSASLFLAHLRLALYASSIMRFLLRFSSAALILSHRSSCCSFQLLEWEVIALWLWLCDADARQLLKKRAVTAEQVLKVDVIVAFARKGNQVLLNR